MNAIALQRFSLSGRLALVTGSSDGIGFALARGLASAGARVVLNGRDERRLETAVEQIKSEGHDAVAACFDVTSPHDVSSGVAAIEASAGPISILFNNAGMQRRAPLEDFPAAQWSELMRTNLDSVFYVSQVVARGMIARGYGKIVNICSVQSELARPGVAPYAASKGAVKMLTKGMAVDWGPHGIQVNGIGPGYIKTRLTQALVDDLPFSNWLTARTPCRRWGDVGDLVGAAIFLSSDASRFVNGHILYVDGGVTAAL